VYITCSSALFGVKLWRNAQCYTIQVLDNKNINADPRHQAISAAADGVPFFKDRNAANGWPVVLYPESGPVGVAASNEDAHMVGMVPSEYWDEDEEGKKVLKKKYACTRGHKTNIHAQWCTL
jgi:hypothetical protein